VLVAVAPPPVGAEFEDVDAVEDWLRKLPRRHAQVCRLHYLYGKTQAEIAEAVGCSQSEVTRLHRKAIELLAEPYDKDGRPSRTGWRRRRRKKKASATVPAASAAPLAS
jgi:DNA-directed RNA polymerase specialized sigma24 family protein